MDRIPKPWVRSLDSSGARGRYGIICRPAILIGQSHIETFFGFRVLLILIIPSPSLELGLSTPKKGYLMSTSLGKPCITKG